MRTGRYRVAAAAKIAGLSPHTLRVWERRHGPFASLRSKGGNRLYAEGDVERVALLKKLVDAGHAISAVVPLRTPELERMARRLEPEPALAPVSIAQAARRKLSAAVTEMDARTIDEVLSRAALALPPRELVEAIVSPLLDEVGRGWASMRLDVAHEHAATAALRNQLGGLLRSFHPARGAATVVVTTPEGDPHELGALGAALVAASAGYRTLYLGPSMPAADIAAAARRSGARAVLLSCVLPAARRIRAIESAVPRGVIVLAGGPGAPAPLALGGLEQALQRIARARG